MYRAKKRFGQHFLQDASVIMQIMQVTDLQPEDQVIDIGPGTGALTQQFMAGGNALTVLEIDPDLAQTLQRSYVEQPHFTLLQTDALRYDWCGLAGSRAPGAPRLRIVGNLPYNIATALIINILRAGIPDSDCHFMVQKEVAERMTAQPGCVAYGYLSVMIHFLAAAEYLFSVPPAAFMPQPRVDSAVVRLRPRVHDTSMNIELLDSWLPDIFAHKRKTVYNNVRKRASADQLAGLDAAAQQMLSQRAEQLHLVQLLHLIRQLRSVTA